MSISLATLKADASQLPCEERAYLADYLLASIYDNNGVEDAWFAEVKQRLAKIEADPTALIPVEQAIANARQSIT